MKSRSVYGHHYQVLQCIRLLLTGVIVLIVSSCSSASDTEVAAGETGDMKIATALYFDERTPDGFYKEDFQNDAFYSISHVKNISLLPVASRIGLAVYELTSNDFVEAMAWSDKAAEYQQSYTQLAGNTETTLYYQFTRFDPESPQFINMHRVFKAGVLDRNGVDRSDEDGNYQGRIAMSGLTVEKVNLIIEYLWMFTLSNNYSNAVLESYTTETDNEFLHIMKQAKLFFSNNESCDAIEVYEIRYTVPKDSGFIWREKVLTRTFSAKRSGTYLEICK